VKNFKDAYAFLADALPAFRFNVGPSIHGRFQTKDGGCVTVHVRPVFSFDAPEKDKGVEVTIGTSASERSLAATIEIANIALEAARVLAEVEKALADVHYNDLHS
jgi:hypothetical protein